MDSALNQLLRNYRDLSRKISGCPFAHTIDEAITLMEQWLTVRDPQKFFEIHIAARDEPAQVCSTAARSINMFYGEQFDRYNGVCKFIDDNRDNFDFLPAEGQETVAALRAIHTDEEPWTKMPAYIKMRKAIETQLQQKRKELVETVTARYNAVFDELEKYAEEMHVSRDKFARRDTTISLNTGTNNFYALQANADTSSFYEEQMHRINAAIPSKPYTPPTPPDNGGGSVHDDGGQPAPPQSRAACAEDCPSEYAYHRAYAHRGRCRPLLGSRSRRN